MRLRSCLTESESETSVDCDVAITVVTNQTNSLTWACLALTLSDMEPRRLRSSWGIWAAMLVRVRVPLESREKAAAGAVGTERLLGTRVPSTSTGAAARAPDERFFFGGEW